MSTPDRLGRVRRRLEEQLAVPGVSESNAEALARIEDLLGRLNHEVHFDVLAALRVALEGDMRLGTALEDLIDHLASIERGQAQITREAVEAPARDAEVVRLLGELGPRPPRRPGLSVVTISWNHGSLLPASVASSLALLDEIDPADRGDVWVLDDASTDDTPEVLVQLRADPRVHSIRASRPLGLSRAREVLLGAVPTSHALVLDADNTILPAAAALYDHARSTGAAFTFGPILVHDPDGRPLGLLSAEPPGSAYLTSMGNSIDTMAVIDVEAVIARGGYTHDPVFGAADDWELVHRLARQGATIGFVPQLVGRYRAGRGRHSSVRKDDDAVRARIDRAYRVDGALDERGIDVALALPEPVHVEAPSRQRVLVVSGGGVANVGDDAILQVTIGRLLAHRPAAEWAIDLVTDGESLPPLAAPGAWLGTLAEVADDPAVLDIGPADLVVLAGGGGLAEPFADSIVARRAALVRHARAAGAVILAAGQGVGPLVPEMAAATTEIFDSCLRIGVRDPGSLDLLESLGVSRQVALVADDAVDLVSDPGASWPEGLPEPGRYLLFHARVAAYNPTGDGRWEELAAVVDAAAAEHGLDVVCVAINDHRGPSELEVAARLADAAERRTTWHLVHATTDGRLAAALCAGSDAAVVGSYHLGLFCLAAGRPALIVAGSEYFAGKADGLSGLLELPGIALRPEDVADDVPRRWKEVADGLAVADLDLAATAAAWWDEALTAADAALAGRRRGD